MNRRTFLALAAAATLAAPLAHSEPVPRNAANLSLRNEVQLAIDRGLAFLKAQQRDDGSWSNAEHPSLTALPLLAFQRDPAGKYKPAPDFMQKAYGYVRTFAKPDGGIYKAGLANYNTSICMTALLGTDAKADEELTARARDYILGQQASGMAKPETDGGIGYGTVGTSPKRGHPDLDNTLIAIEALRAYRSAQEAKNGGEWKPKNDLNWDAAIAFLSRTQNLPSHNKLEWASDDAANKGGFLYYPGFSNAGEQELPSGKKALRSYGSMSYAGLLSFIYADVKKDDPRVTAALNWLRGNFSLEENPGLEQRGYYYYLHLMTKALAAAGITELEVKDGKKIDWAREVAGKLISKQQGEGQWVNTEGRWMETDPVLVTTYSVLALEIIYHRL